MTKTDMFDRDGVRVGEIEIPDALKKHDVQLVVCVGPGPDAEAEIEAAKDYVARGKPTASFAHIGNERSGKEMMRDVLKFYDMICAEKVKIPHPIILSTPFPVPRLHDLVVPREDFAVIPVQWRVPVWNMGEERRKFNPVDDFLTFDIGEPGGGRAGITEYLHMSESKVKRRKGRRCVGRAVRHHHIKIRHYRNCYPSNIGAVDPCEPGDIVRETIDMMKYEPLAEHLI